MTGLPHDVTDLYLAPVAMSLDAVLEEWGALDQDDLALKASPYAGIRPEWTRDDRAEAFDREHAIDRQPKHAGRCAWRQRVDELRELLLE